MGDPSEMAKRIRALRGTENQVPFANRLGVSQATISSWELDQDTPAPLSCLLLGLLASGSEREWFFKSVGPDLQTMMAAADAILKGRSAAPSEGEIIRVPCVRKTAQGTEEIGTLVALPAEKVPNPLSTVCLVVDEHEASPLVSSGDLIVLDTSQKAAPDLRAFLNQIVLVEATGSANLTGWRGGLLIGRLLLKRFGTSTRERPWHSFLVTVGTFGDSRTVWEPRDLEAVRLGEWTRLLKIELLHPIMHDGVKYLRGVHDLPADVATLFLSFRWHGEGPEQGTHMARLFKPEGEAVKESDVAGEIRLYPGCQILGIVRALFPAPGAQAKD